MKKKDAFYAIDKSQFQVENMENTTARHGEKINSKYQDTIFRDLFNNDKKMLLHLYRVLHYEDEDIELISDCVMM